MKKTLLFLLLLPTLLFSQTTIVDSASYIYINDNGAALAISKPFTCQYDTDATLYLNDSYSNEKTVFLSQLTGWSYSDIYDLQKQLLALNSIGQSVPAGAATEATLLQVKTNTGNIISAGNSTAALLGAGATFAGAWENVVDYTTAASTILGSMVTNGTLYFDLSTDGGVTYTSVPSIISDATFAVPRIVNIVETHIRVRYVNGSTPQTGTFSIQTKYSNGQPMALLTSVDGFVRDETPTEVVRAISTAKNASGQYVNARASSVDANNTTTTALVALDTFTGYWCDLSAYHGITILVDGTSATPADGTLYMQFSHDSTIVNRNISIPTVDIASTPPRTLGVVAKYFRIRYGNGTTAQTTLDIQTMFHTTQVSIVSRLDGSLVGTEDVANVRAVIAGQDDQNVFQNVKVTGARDLAVAVFDAETGSKQIIDRNGSAKVGQSTILVGDVFGNNEPNPLQWDTTRFGSGQIANDIGLLKINTGTTANSFAEFQSVKKARFMLSQFNIFHCGLKMNNIADTECERRFGAFDPINASQNGVYFALIDGVWSVGYCKNGVETLIPQSNWNGTSKGAFVTGTDLSPYEIHYNAGSIYFYQRGNFIHRIAGLPSPYASEYNFKVGCHVTNTGGNVSDNEIDLYAIGIYRLGKERGETISRVFTANTLIKKSSGYINNAYLSRIGNTGGDGTLIVYDGIDNTGEVMGRIDIGGDDLKGIPVKSTFSDGLYIEVSGSGIVSATISYE